MGGGAGPGGGGAGAGARGGGAPPRARGARILASLGGTSAAAAPLPSHWYPTRDASAAVLKRAADRAGITREELVGTLGRSEHRAEAVGMSAVLPLFHLAAQVMGGRFPVATVADGRGGAARAAVLTAPGI